jgi:hypothetical protein
MAMPAWIRMDGTAVEVLRAEVAMRTCLTAAVLCVVVLVPRKGNAQAYYQPTPAPAVDAGSADWQISGQPVFYAGAFYYRTGPSVFFDGNVMVRTGVYRGVPLYVDASLDPYGVVYVPIGGNLMRPYERPRAGDLAGTVGSRMPSFPIQLDVEVPAAAARTGVTTLPLAMDIESTDLAESGHARRGIGTGGSIVQRPTASEESVPIEDPGQGNTIVESIPPPRMNSGIWLEFDGTRWYSSGAAVPYSADRFTQVGDHCGFPVYREKAGKPDEIFVAAMKDGPVAPFRR